jgi:hypothetical protein
MSETVQLLRTFNRWRRGDKNLEQPCPRVVGEMIDAACDEIERLQRDRDEARFAARAGMTTEEMREDFLKKWRRDK